MKKLYVLCFITLAAVFVDIVFVHSTSVSARAPRQYEVRGFNPVKVPSFNSADAVAGFSCVESQGSTGSATSCWVLWAK